LNQTSLVLYNLTDAPPNSLKDSNASLKMKITEEEKVGVHSLIRSTWGWKGHVGILGWGLRRVTSGSIFHMNLHKLNNKLVSA
jgi:hypothetical protein